MHHGRHEAPRGRRPRWPLGMALMMVLGTMAAPAWAGRPDDFDAKGNVLHMVSDAGFDDFGYNNTARIFSGPADGVDRLLDGKVWGDPTYANDLLVMKWSKAWDDARFHGASWTEDAWVTNEWNGMTPGGSGDMGHYKIQWVGSCGDDYTPLPDGGYCIWGQFEVIMDQGMLDGTHTWFALALPNGFGS